MTSRINLSVIDTHALVWYLEDSTRLSPDARSAFHAIDQGLSVGVIQTIVLAELMHIAERGRTPLGFAEVLSRIQDSEIFGIASLDLGILMRMRSLTTLELHDRIIVAPALSFGAILVTPDESVRNSGLIECVW